MAHSDSDSSVAAYERSGEWVIGLCEVGDPASCALSFFCSPCALAYSRSNLDDSSCVFNLLCLPYCCMPVSRWLLRTAYDIKPALGSDSMDCIESSFLPCCVVNQMFQTSASYGNTSSGGGHFSNVRDFHLTLGSCKDEIGDIDNYIGNTCLCLYSFLCFPCATSESLDLAMGMPQFYGCCCVTPCAARNLVRYQFRIRGDDLLEEVCLPTVAGLALWAGTTSILAPIPVLGMMLPESYAETRFRGRTGGNKYLTVGGHETFVPYESYHATAYGAEEEEERLLNTCSRDDMTVNSEADAQSYFSADFSLPSLHSAATAATGKASIGMRVETRGPERRKDKEKGLGDPTIEKPARGPKKLKSRHLPRANHAMLAQQWDREFPSAETSYEVRQPIYRPKSRGGDKVSIEGSVWEADERPPATTA